MATFFSPIIFGSNCSNRHAWLSQFPRRCVGSGSHELCSCMWLAKFRRGGSSRPFDKDIAMTQHFFQTWQTLFCNPMQFPNHLWTTFHNQVDSVHFSTLDPTRSPRPPSIQSRFRPAWAIVKQYGWHHANRSWTILHFTFSFFLHLFDAPPLLKKI